MDLCLSAAINWKQALSRNLFLSVLGEFIFHMEFLKQINKTKPLNSYILWFGI